MTVAFGRDALLDAFDRIGRAAVAAGTKLQIAVYGGSALMLASNFRFATEDVDIARREPQQQESHEGNDGDEDHGGHQTGSYRPSDLLHPTTSLWCQSLTPGA